MTLVSKVPFKNLNSNEIFYSKMLGNSLDISTNDKSKSSTNQIINFQLKYSH